ncbi:MAG: hypothetical protein CMJ18_26980 [Phycisphaeraceae bacterium]|nr:hypothetical protein [Phycisphaeraceae bacterium]
MNDLKCFLAVMEYEPAEHVPNWEAGVWPQTRRRWEREGLDPHRFHFDWFSGEAALGMDAREFIHFDGDLVPPFEQEVLEEDEQTVVFRDTKGRVRRALKKDSVGEARMCMDTYLRHVVETPDDWQRIKKRYQPGDARRYEPNWRDLRVEGWRARHHPLIFGPNMSTMGFYWFARELMGTENLSFAWYDQPKLMDDMMEHWEHFLIEAARPILDATSVEYVCLSEDLSMKTGPLLGPETYRRFIFPHLCRVIGFFKSRGVRYVCIDTDGNPEPLIPMMLDAGVDAIWPLERTAGQDPQRLRRTFGRSLRLWGGVDKRELAMGPEAIDAHLNTLVPMIEEGGFIPTVDHSVPPDVSWDHFRHYMERKQDLLRGRL